MEANEADYMKHFCLCVYIPVEDRRKVAGTGDEKLIELGRESGTLIESRVIDFLMPVTEIG